MAKTEYDRYGNPIPKASPKEQINTAVIDIIDAPKVKAEEERVAAEIAKRTEFLNKIGVTDEYPNGTVLQFTKKHYETDHVWFAAKVDLGKDQGGVYWFVTGYRASSEFGSSSNGQTYDQLLRWMTTGNSPAENLQIAGAFTPVV